VENDPAVAAEQAARGTSETWALIMDGIVDSLARRSERAVYFPALSLQAFEFWRFL